jgi:hypothetical protein
MTPYRNLRLALLPLALSCLHGVAAAEESSLRISGFGTAGVVRSNSSTAEFAEVGQPRGASRRRSFSPDSKAAAQLDGWLNDRVSGTLQVMSRYNGNGNEHPTIERAFGKVNLGNDWSLRAGRMGSQYFAVSDFRDINYANVWLRPPTDVYGQITLRNFDGVSLAYQSVWNGTPLNLQLYTGGAKEPLGQRNVEFKNQIGFNATADVLDGVALRVGYVQGKLTVRDPNVDALVGLLSQIPPYQALASDIACDRKRTGFAAVGVSVDRDDWVASAEYTRGQNHCFVPNTEASYLLLGHRFGDFTPYVLASRLRVTSSNFQNTVAPGPTPTDFLLNSATSALLSTTNASQSTKAIGMRWDAVRNLAVKVQWERIDAHGGPGLFNNVTPLVYSLRPVDVMSAVVDFVF